MDPTEPLSGQDVVFSARTAAVAEIAYPGGPGGSPRVEPVTPLLLGESPAIALPYADSELARALGAARRVLLAFSDSRLAYVGWKPLTVAGGTDLIPDPEGAVFLEELLHQEVVKFPPSRDLIDSPMLRRENWWYVPRWILRLTDLGEPQPLVRRTSPDHGLLAWDDAGGLGADTVRVADWDAGQIPFRSLASDAPPLPDGARATLFFHDFSIPDMEQRATFWAWGRLRSGRLHVQARTGSRNLGRRPGVIARLRRQRALEKGCKAGLRTYS